MKITLTELEDNLEKYVTLASTEDILITENGKVVAMLSKPSKTKFDILNEISGSIPNDITAEEARNERISQI